MTSHDTALRIADLIGQLEPGEQLDITLELLAVKLGSPQGKDNFLGDCIRAVCAENE